MTARPVAALLGAPDAVAHHDSFAFVEVSPWRDGAEDGDAIVGSIPAAHAANVRTHFAGEPTASSGHLPLPAPPELATLRLLAARWAGVDRRALVLYTRRAEAFTSATRAWFVLAAAGVTDVSILDGGLPAWVRAGGELRALDPDGPPRGREHAAVATVGAGGAADARDAGDAPASVRTLAIDDVEELPRYGTLLDARPADAYHGLTGQPRTGHIPGAVHAPAAELLAADGTLVSPLAIRRWFLAHRALGGHEIAAYCNGGVASSALVFAGALVGQPVALYVDSWSAWGNDPTRPVEQGIPRSRPSGQDLDCLE
ncbi:sulfurtransferase [Agromyces sp. MMS24-K17]|uniref:sulfurtransferase n=1 Tax=Agromyces sp. MMS24-K17 TaxID=3372850 RepID=UPI0037541A12